MSRARSDVSDPFHPREIGSVRYSTNSLSGAWDDQFYPDGVGAWMAKLDVADSGGITFDERFFLEGEAFRGRRPHQVSLQGRRRLKRLPLLSA